MAIEGHFEDFDRESFKKEQNEDPRIDDAFSVVDEDPSDPHFSETKPRPDKFTDNEFEVARKFKKRELTEEELNEKFKKVGDLKEGNPRLEFFAAIRNKILKEWASKYLEEKRKKKESEQ